MLDSSLCSEQLDFVQSINANCDLMLAIVNDGMNAHPHAHHHERTILMSVSCLVLVLDISKLQAGKLVVERFPFDYHLLLNSLVAINKTTAAQKGLSLNLLIAQDVPMAR